ncbi:MAG: glycosyltransferase family 2 protein [Halioglobus sp.]
MTDNLHPVDISICIANYNGSEILGACLESIYQQNTRASYEIIVHDDASTDGSIEGLIAAHPRVRIIKAEHNVGYCVSNQRMAKEAEGSLLLLLNNDVELMSGALEALYSASLDTAPSIYSLTEYSISGELSCRGMGMDIFFTPFHCKSPQQKVAFAMGACLMIDRELWFEIGGYPEFFEYTCEDFYLCLKARARGVPVRIIDESGYRHHMGKSINPEGISLQRRRNSERNRLYIINELLPVRERIFIWPLFMMNSFLEMAWHAASMRSFAPLRPLPGLKEHESEYVSVWSLLTWRATKLLYFLGRS